MLHTSYGAGAVGAGAASSCGSGHAKMMRLLAVPTLALQHCIRQFSTGNYTKNYTRLKNFFSL
jgi:hypothetical protein